MSVESPFLTLKEAAQLLRYSTSSLYKRLGKITPRFKLPGSKDWRYDREELLAWAKSSPDTQKRMQPKSEPPASVPANDTSRKAVRRPFNSRYRSL